MTDLERFEGLLDDFGIEYEKNIHPEVKCRETIYPEFVEIEFGDSSRKHTGYIGFFTSFRFSEDGSFIDFACVE